MSSNDSGRRLISIIVPTMNESGNVAALYERICEVFERDLADYDWELILTDNRSDDDTFDIVTELASQDPRVRAYRLAKNFGYQRSIFAGYLLTSGHAVVQVDADMQDPPELIPELVKRWEAGAHVVYGIRRKRRGENPLLSATRKVFYRLIDWLSEEELPRDAGDFRLVDRTIVEILRHTHDQDPYLRGSIASMGFEQVGFEYERDDRTAGETKFRFRSLVRLAVDGILNHSTRPLQLASVTSVIIVVVSILGIAGYIIGRALFGQTWPAGFVSLALLQLIGILLNAAFLGIIGAYLGRLYRQSKSAPFVVIERSTTEPATSKLLTATPPVAFSHLHLITDQEAPPHE